MGVDFRWGSWEPFEGSGLGVTVGVLIGEAAEVAGACFGMVADLRAGAWLGEKNGQGKCYYFAHFFFIFCVLFQYDLYRILRTYFQQPFQLK